MKFLKYSVVAFAPFVFSPAFAAETTSASPAPAATNTGTSTSSSTAPATPSDPRPSDPKPSQATSGAKKSAGGRDVASLLFETPQWGKVSPGSTLTYAYSKKTSDPALGPSFDDKIKLKIDKAGEPDERGVEVKMFSGAHARPAGPFESTAQNPVLLLVFEKNVQDLSKLFKANPRYLKNTIRKAWRDNAKIEDVSVDVAGKSVPGTRITVTPFLDDPERSNMMGLEGITYVVEISDSIPGQIAGIDIHAPATGKAKFSETLRYEGETQ